MEDERHREDHILKDRVEIIRVVGEEIVAAGLSKKFGDYTLTGRVSPAEVLGFYHRGDAKRHFSGGVVIMKLQINSRTIMSGIWYEYDADRQFYGGTAVWTKTKPRH